MTDGGNGARAKVVTWAALATGVTLAATIIGGSWSILHWLYTENNQLRADITAVRIETAANQVTKEELRDVVQGVSARLEKRLDKLEERLFWPNGRLRIYNGGAEK